MNLINVEIFMKDSQDYRFEEIDHTQESYWKYTEMDYGIEEYAFENIEELKDKIVGMTGVGIECAKCMAIEAIKRYFCNTVEKREEEQQINLPDFVYRL